MPGVLPHPPARIVAQAIIDLGYGSTPDVRNPVAWGVYYSGEPASPDEVITVTGTTGLSEGTTQTDGEDQERYGLQVRVRGMNEDSAHARANAIAVALHAVNYLGVVVSSAPYLISSLQVVGGVTSLTKGDPTSSRSIMVFNMLGVIDADG